MYQPTTALRKIATLKKRIRAIQGGQGAGKTISILIILINYAQHNPNAKVTIAAGELSKMKKTIVKDFLSIMKSYGFFSPLRWNKTDSTYSLPNGSFLEFIGLDAKDIGKGFRRDVIYFNELNKGGITLEAFMQFASRAAVTYADFNPDRKFWLHEEFIDNGEADFLILTFNDNEFLPEGEREFILDYLKRGFYNPDAKDLFAEDNIKSKYWANKWRVYGLGIPGQLDGVIFDDWQVVDRVPPAAAYLGSGMDFGYSNDPTTLVDCYRYNGKLIWDEILYKTGMVNSEIARAVKDRERLIYADAAEPKSIEEIRRQGVRIYGADKGRDSINYGIDLLQQDKFYVTARSKNLIRELESYTWDVKKDGSLDTKPISNYDHTIDAMRYFAIMKLKTGVGKYAVR